MSKAALPAMHAVLSELQLLAGELQCIVATTAFGMGINCPCVRWVSVGCTAPSVVGQGTVDFFTLTCTQANALCITQSAAQLHVEAGAVLIPAGGAPQHGQEH